MSPLRSWFDARAPREKKLLLVMAALAVLTLIWGAIIRPVGDGLSSARERHADAVTRLGETQGQVAALKAIQRGRPRPLTGTLADVVRIEADQADFTLTSLDQDGANVRVAIQSARPAAIVAWLARLERIGILVDSAAMTDTGNKSVGVTLVLKARAS